MGNLSQREGVSKQLIWQQKKGKDNKQALDLKKWVGRSCLVKLTGGREVTGVLKGFDTMVNLVLDDCVETIRDLSDPYKLTDDTRTLGLVVCRGPSVMLVMPV